MKPQCPNAFDPPDHKLIRRWTMIVAALYAVVLVAMLTIIGPGDARHDTGALAGISDEIDTLAAFESARQTAARLAADTTSSTTGVGNSSIADAHGLFNKPSEGWPSGGGAPILLGAEALVENGWDFSAVDGVPGFGSLPPTGTTAADELRQSAGAKQ